MGTGGFVPRSISRRMFLSFLGVGAGAFALRFFAHVAVPLRPGDVAGPRPRTASSLDVRTTPAGMELRPLPLEDDGPVYRLNDTGAFIWQCADGRTSVLEISKRVATEYQVPASRALRDTACLLDSLRAAGLTFALET
jgi:hypothetical protein